MVLLPPGVNPIAVDKYISYHIPVVKLTITEWGIRAGDHNKSTHFLHCDCHWTLYTRNTN